MRQLSLITMTQGNPIALKRTLESLKDVVSEVILGDVIIFKEDRELIQSYAADYNMRIVPLPFNYIFLHGFASVLNLLADLSTNDMVLYLNVGEIIDGDHRILGLINHFDQYNTYAFDHATDPHTWFRTYNRKELRWSGVIHEVIEGDKKPAPFYLFRMADTDKDMDNAFKAKVADDVKEIVYFNNYLKLIDEPDSLGATSVGWVSFVRDNYESIRHRLFDKRERYEAFIEGNLRKYLNAVHDSPSFEQERFESSRLIEYQGSPMFLGKK